MNKPKQIQEIEDLYGTTICNAIKQQAQDIIDIETSRPQNIDDLSRPEYSEQWITKLETEVAEGYSLDIPEYDRELLAKYFYYQIDKLRLRKKNSTNPLHTTKASSKKEYNIPKAATRLIKKCNASRRKKQVVAATYMQLVKIMQSSPLTPNCHAEHNSKYSDIYSTYTTLWKNGLRIPKATFIPRIIKARKIGNYLEPPAENGHHKWQLNTLYRHLFTPQIQNHMPHIMDCIFGTKTTIFVGAGISAAAGIPTFTGDDGIYNNEHKPKVKKAWSINKDGTINADEFYKYTGMFYTKSFRPTETHNSLKWLQEQRGNNITIVSMNIDNLQEIACDHQYRPLHIHGCITDDHYCQSCKSTTTFEQVQRQFANQAENTIPRCKCGGELVPNIVFYGQDIQHQEKLLKVIDDSDHIVVLGSSLTVEPLAGLIATAAKNGRMLTIVNDKETGIEKSNITPDYRVSSLETFNEHIKQYSLGQESYRKRNLELISGEDADVLIITHLAKSKSPQPCL